jgi:hypothetical protein
MAVYYIVADGTPPLGPNQIEAGGTIQVHDGDTFIFEAGADKSTTFELASGEPLGSDFAIAFTSSNTSGSNFDVKIKSDLNPDISVANGVDIDNIHIDASNADSTTFTAGDGTSLKSFTGSSSGPDTVIIGDTATVSGNIDTQGGADSVTIGDNGTFNGEIRVGSGDDQLTIGSGNTFVKKITMDGGADNLSVGDNNTFNYTIDTGDGVDTVTFGDNNTIDELWTGNEADVVDIGFVDSSVAQTIDGVNHNPGTIIDVLRIDVSDDRAGFEAELLNNGYIKQPDGTYIADGSTDFHIVWNNVQINDFEKIIICFVRGTLLDTPNGPKAVEELEIGDLVDTLDHGPQEIRWIGRRMVPAVGKFAPVRIKKGALGNRRDLLVSPQHRMLLTGCQMELLFGEEQVLATAKSLVDDHSILIQPGGLVEYHHIMFDQHEIVFAEGAPSESFYSGDQAINSLSEATRDELFDLFPELASEPSSYGCSARADLKLWEGKLARSQMAQLGAVQ